MGGPCRPTDSSTSTVEAIARLHAGKRIAGRRPKIPIELMKHHPTKVLGLSSEGIRWLVEVIDLSQDSRRLRFTLSNGTMISGVYGGCFLVPNQDGWHSCTAKVSPPDSDYPIAVDLTDVVAVHSERL